MDCIVRMDRRFVSGESGGRLTWRRAAGAPGASPWKTTVGQQGHSLDVAAQGRAGTC